MFNLLRLHFCVILATCMLAMGCDASHKQAVRSKPPEDPTAWSQSSLTDRSESSNDSDAGTGKGLFKPSRLPGALSSEGSEIERSLGVGR